MYTLLKQVAMAVLVCAAPTICRASIEISFTDAGWYRNNGTNSGLSPNNIVQLNGTSEIRNFFVFDLAGVTDTILSATLRIENFLTANNGVASTYTVYDVSTSIASLMTNQAGTAIFTDLGSGASYGSVVLGSTVSPGIVEITLNATAIAAMNATSGLFAFGGSLTAGGTGLVQLFASTSGPEYVRTLLLEVEESTTTVDGIVPEPASVLVWCGVAMLVGCGTAARRVAAS